LNNHQVVTSDQRLLASTTTNTAANVQQQQDQQLQQQRLHQQQQFSPASNRKHLESTDHWLNPPQLNMQSGNKRKSKVQQSGDVLPPQTLSETNDNNGPPRPSFSLQVDGDSSSGNSTGLSANRTRSVVWL